MPKIAYKQKKWSEDKLEQVQVANRIIVAYQAQGLKLTLRQLYYRSFRNRFLGLRARIC